MSEYFSPLISLIVPCYNVAWCCDTFFASLERQTYTNIQLIIVNDGSEDDTEEKVQGWLPKLERRGYQYEYVWQENKGLGGAINTGLKKIRGDYFCWADPDDYYEDNAFEVRVNYLKEHSDCAVLTCGGYYVNNGERTPMAYPKHHFEKKQFELLLNYESVFFPGGHLISTKCFETVNPQKDIYEARRGQDWQLLLPVYYAFDRDTLDIPVYNYVVYPNSMSHSDSGYEQKLKRIEESETIQLETLKRMLMPESDREKYMKHIRAFHAKLKLYNARSFDKKEEFNKYLKEAISLGEMDFKDWLRVARYMISGR